MAIQIIFNVLIAFMWMFLSETYDFVAFVKGLMIGAILLFFLRRFLPGKYYIVRVYKLIKLNFIFLRELIFSTFAIIALVYKPKMTMEPGIFKLPTELKSDWELSLLSNLISLTPGTLTVAVGDDNRTLYIHAMDLPDVEAQINDIKNTFEKAILEVTR
ncbi:Na+/H+ antiporter subunit E [Halalkalibacillus halophilus]|uniref:Na+/H+ antiporter subunit E n=1 Tax=Halalkalibacillus halophilus TaxID=392827 RepID=UPI0004124BD7|nr:Na+/H+ antiporter subunit E [Halalkalibacillus halophilus]